MANDNFYTRSVNYWIHDYKTLKNLKLKNFKTIEQPQGIFLSESSGKESAIEFDIESPFYFDELICSVSAVIHSDNILETKIKIGTKEYSCGKFSEYNSESYSAEDEKAKVDVDVIDFKEKINKFSVKINLTNNASSTDTIRLINFVLTDRALKYDKEKATQLTNPNKVNLKIKQISQMAQQVDYFQDICSPTSVSMVLDYYGIKEDPVSVARKVIDNSNNIYGNWIFNTSYVSRNGLYSIIVRLNSLSELYEYLEKKIPIIASITFGPDELKNSPIKKSKGHLVVIKGMDENGNVIVNDPAASDNSKVEIKYLKDEFANAWLNNKFGTAYLIFKDINDFISPKIPYSELFSRAIDQPNNQDYIETQVLPDEKIKIIGKNQFELMEQKTYDKKNNLVNYIGYLDKFSYYLPIKYNAIIWSKNPEIYDLNFYKLAEKISMGTEILVIEKKNEYLLSQLQNRLFYIREKDVFFLPREKEKTGSRDEIIKLARQFINDPYYWGGRTSFGVDCSGLVNLVYKIIGYQIPRNARDQFLYSKPVSISDLKPGDLIFSTAENSSFIDHVMIYSGGENIIEATKDSNSVREIPFRQKFGFDLNKLKNGQKIKNKTVYFRRILQETKAVKKPVKNKTHKK